MAERLIDAEALLEKAWDVDCRCGYVQVVDVGSIEEAPTIEAKPVVHAHWEYIGESDGKKIYRCTSCKSNICGTGNYCKECGATMDKVVVEENATTKNNTQKVSVDGVKIPVISMEDVPKLAKEMEK